MNKSPEYEKGFDHGVVFILEELALHDTAYTVYALKLLWATSLRSDWKRYIAAMKKNNPGIYQESVRPLIEHIN